MANNINDYPYPLNLVAAVCGAQQLDCPIPADLDDSVEYVLADLQDGRAAELIRFRFREHMTYRELGLWFCIDRSRASQIITHTLRKLRHPSRAMYLRDGYAQTEEKNAVLEAIRIEKQNKIEAVRSAYYEDCADTPIHVIRDRHKRVDTIMARSGFQRLQSMMLPTRAENCLIRFGKINYIWEICFLTPKELLRYNGFGVGSLSDVVKALERFDLELDDGMLSSAPGLWKYANQRFQSWERAVPLGCSDE